MLLIIYLKSGGDVEEGSETQLFAWLFIGTVVLCSIYTMIAVNFMAGLGMFGSLSFFSVEKSQVR